VKGISEKRCAYSRSQASHPVLSIRTALMAGLSKHHRPGCCEGRPTASLRRRGYRSIAIVFAHSTPSLSMTHYCELASSVGFTHISLSSQLLPMIKMVAARRVLDSRRLPHADTARLPRRVLQGLDEKLPRWVFGQPRVEFMGSDGGLVDTERFSGLKSILSGPGVACRYALTSWDEDTKTRL